MIVRRLFLVLATAVAFAACAGVCVVALAFALFAFAVPYVGEAGAGGVVAGAAALIMGLGAGILALGARSKKPKKPPPGATGLFDRALALVREKPVLAIVAAIGGGLLAVRDPKYLGAAVRGFVEDRRLPKR